jgi:hypothetical protein
MRALRRFYALSPSQRRLVLRSLLLVATVRIGLVALPFVRLRSLLSRFGEERDASGANGTHSAAELAWAVQAASRYVPKATCLVQALTLELLMARSGQAGQLRIGVAKENGDLKAHAWVEADGRRWLEDAEPTRFSSLPATWQS